MKRLVLFVAVVFAFSTMAFAAEKPAAKETKAVTEVEAAKSGGTKISSEDEAVMKEKQQAAKKKIVKKRAAKKAKKAEKAAKEAEDAKKAAEAVK
ncbi:MAG TPA: hypothetical protein PKN70_09115 [Smithellaceae bacterium]|jgi:hypothetical protein|nr:hypothetical protein [Smithellaceae bacterium]HQM46628.1 hypothetical protein [Smithellaceae bacterium]